MKSFDWFVYRIGSEIKVTYKGETKNIKVPEKLGIAWLVESQKLGYVYEVIDHTPNVCLACES